MLSRHGNDVKPLNIFPVIELMVFIDSSKGNSSLAFVTLSCTWHPFLLTIFPRAANIAFKYSQAFLIDSAVSYLAHPADTRDKNHAYGLIGATGLVYLGMTVGSPHH